MNHWLIYLLIVIVIRTLFYFYRIGAFDRKSSVAPIPKPIPIDETVPDTPFAFGYKCSWFAVSTENTTRLVELMHLNNARPCNWQAGVERVYQDQTFISPSVDGWSFIVSQSNLPTADTVQGVEEVKQLLILLSKEFSRAQYFGTYRTVSYDSWIMACDGQIVRAYGFVDGENTIVEGEPTKIEKKYDLVNTLSEEALADEKYFDREDLDYPDEEMTMQIAGAWSIDPQTLTGRKDVTPALGMVGAI